MKRVLRLHVASAIILAALLISCATSKTTLTNVWVDDQYQGQQFRKIFVIGPSQKQEVRILFENEFVNQLKKYGTEGIPSYRMLPQDTMLDKADIAAKAREVKADGVLITRIVFREMADQRQSRSDVPEGYYYRMPDYYGRSFSSSGEILTNAPGNQLYRMEANLYDPKTEKLIWTASSYVSTKGDPRSAIPSFIEVMTGNLYSEKLLR